MISGRTTLNYVPDFLTRVGRFPTTFRAVSLTARPAFFAASERFPPGLLAPGRFLFPATFRAESPLACPAFFAASDNNPAGLLFFDLAMTISQEDGAKPRPPR